MKNKTVYLDNNATTQIDPRVVNAIVPFLKNNYFNPSSAYSEAKTVRDAVEKARKEIAEFLGAEMDSEIIFMGSASESNNIAIKGVLAANSKDRQHIITTKVEHPSVYEMCKDLNKNGYEVTFLDVDEDGKLDIRQLIQAIRPDTAVVSIMHANNETGVLFPIEQLSRIVKLTDPQIVFHTDATQTVGKIPIDLKNDFPYVDMLTFSGHKIYAPKGVGVLYCRKGVPCRPIIVGGHQEKGRRAGTENVAYIVGLSMACKIASEYFKKDDHTIGKFRDDLEQFLVKNIPAVRINGGNAPRLDSTSNISFQGIEGESLLYALNEEGICCSTGSACSSGSLAPSHVLQAMKIPFSFAHGSLRFSFGRFNTVSDLDKLLKVLPKIVSRLREISPFWDNKTNQPIEGDDWPQN